MLKEILLHKKGQGSRKQNNVGYLNTETNIMKISKEANDWSKNHVYGIEIKRQDVIKNNLILEKLKNLNHENIMKVYNYNEDWVWVEYIDGLLLSNRRPWTPDTPSCKKCYLDLTNEFNYDKIITTVKYFHKENIAVTDIASFNIMVDKYETPKFIDLICCMPLTEELRQLDLKRLEEVYIELCNDFPNKIKRSII